MNFIAVADEDEDFEVEHDRPNCIGCGACASVYEKNWTMNADGKSDVIKKDIDGRKGSADFDGNMTAAESCPVNVIHIVGKKTKKKLI